MEFEGGNRWSWLGIQKETDKEIAVAFGLKPENIPASFREQWPYGCPFFDKIDGDLTHENFI